MQLSTALLCSVIAGSAFAQKWEGWHSGPSHGHNDGPARVIDLSGSAWTLNSQNGSIKLPATALSQQHLDLYNANIIPDPLFGENNAMLAWLGSLYWQLNDLWNTPSWSSIEYNIRQKLLRYTVKDIFSPLIVYPYYNQNTSDLQIWVTSDQMTPVSGNLTYQWYHFEGNVLAVGGTVPTADSQNQTSRGNATAHPPSHTTFNVGAINSTQILHYSDLQTTLSSSNINMTYSLLWLSITAGDFGHSAVFHSANLKDIKLPDPGLKMTNDGDSFTVTATKGIAAWVWLDYDSNDVLGYWSEDAFWLRKGESKAVRFTVWRDGTAGKWRDGVRVRSVWDNTKT